ncbi:uncharacterized protein E0L32_007023 [Thyridium curvatum]|uniref:Uncharacterized protein n=1 Tax=Thyridium curvatum TaxID=1093900 RepID=A0A507AZX4_9PEZI|nr:uncharacterized protein E0L32_007023 [Thyridium curvatum]TPX12376.1 hypothetical protein E0L32_007023 [Thyridium curvatum]
MYFNITSPPGFAIPRDKLRVVATDIEGCRFVFKLEQYQQHRELPNMECIPFDYIPREMVYKAEESSPDSHTGTWVSDGRDFPSSPWYDSNDYMLDSSPRNYYGGVSNLPLQRLSRINGGGHRYSQPYPEQDSPLSCLFKPYFSDVALLPGNDTSDGSDISALQQCPDLGFPTEFAPAGHDVSPPDKLAASAAGARAIGDHQDITPPPPAAGPAAAAATEAAAAAPAPGLTNNPSAMDASYNGFAIDGLPRVLPDLDPDLFQVQTSCFAAPYTAAPANQYALETPPGYPVADGRDSAAASLHSPFPLAELPPLLGSQAARDCSSSIAWRDVIMQQQQQQQQARGPMLPNLRDLAPPSQPAWSSSPWQIYYADSSSESGGDDNAFGERMDLDDIPSPPQQRAHPAVPVEPQPRKPLPEGRADRLYTPVVPILPSNDKGRAPPPPADKIAGNRRRPLPNKSRSSTLDKKSALPGANGGGGGGGDSDSDAPLQNKSLLRRRRKPAVPAPPPPSSSDANKSSSSSSSSSAKKPHSYADDDGAIEPVDLSSGSKRERDAFLLRCRGAGMSYREIKAAGNFAEAESTLRGRHRNLTTAVKDRVRKPVWLPEDHLAELRRVRPQGIPLGLALDQRRARQHRPVEREHAHVTAVLTPQPGALAPPRTQHERVPGHAEVVADLRLRRLANRYPALLEVRLRPRAQLHAQRPAGPFVEPQIHPMYPLALRIPHAIVQPLRKRPEGEKRPLPSAGYPIRQDVPPVTVTAREPVPHPLHGQELHVPVRLAGARVLAAVEEGEQLLAAAPGLPGVRLDARVRGGQVGGLEQAGLRLVGARREDEVLRHDGELVQDEVVRRRVERADEHRRGRVVEGVKGFCGGAGRGRWSGRRFGLVG